MRYRSLTIIIVCMAIVFIVIDSSRIIQDKIMDVGDEIKNFVLDSRDSLHLSYERYFNQAQVIKEYEQQVKDYQKLQLELQKTHNELDALSLFDTQQSFYNDAKFLPARVYSYVGVGDFGRVWINFDVSDYPEERMFGIVQDGKALGIAIVQNRRLVGFLNGEKKSSYSVCIGDSKIPAIIHYNKLSAEKIVADYIPSWEKVNIGDQVYTSGLDGIFIAGILVGEVVSVSDDYGYITAEVKPYAQQFNLGYVWLIDTNIPQTNFKDLP